MRLLFSIDIDEKGVLDYCVADLCHKDYRKRVKERVQLYLKTEAKHKDFLGLLFDDKNAPVSFYSGLQKISTNLFVISPLLTQNASPVQPHELASGIFEVADCSAAITPSYPMADVECVISDEGFFYKGFHVNSGDMVMTAPIPVDIIAKKLGIKSG